MKNFAIISDSTCDLSSDILKEFDIEIINAHFMDKDGTDHLGFTDWNKCDCYESSSEFYKALKNNPVSFKTAAPSIPEIVDAFEKIIKEGKDILAFSISSVMSGTFNLYNKAKEEILAKYSDANIKIIDTLRFGIGIGLMEINASLMRKEGKTLDEVYAYFEANKNRYHQMGWLDDLSFVAKKGRITHSKAFFGQLIGIKPLGESDQNGLTTVLYKAKGEKSAYDIMIKYIEKTIENSHDQIMVICHSVREKQALEYKKLIEEKFKPKKIYVVEMHPSCGINCGPGLMCAYYVGKMSSVDLVEEKKLIEELAA